MRVCNECGYRQENKRCVLCNSKTSKYVEDEHKYIDTTESDWVGDELDELDLIVRATGDNGLSDLGTGAKMGISLILMGVVVTVLFTLLTTLRNALV